MSATTIAINRITNLLKKVCIYIYYTLISIHNVMYIAIKNIPHAVNVLY